MWASAWNTLKDCLIAIAVVVAFFGAFRAFLGVLALECFMANLLAIIVLCQAWSIFKGAGYIRFSPSVEEPVGQKPLCVSTFS
jgi:divalent metal cation (Fe/Co/Zn/Cd) transporter